MAERLEELTLYIYTTAEKIAREQGIILADTKVEFGTDSYRGEITLGDELLTPDSSRFWDASEYEPGKSQPSFDKQYVRDWLRSPEAGWTAPIMCLTCPRLWWRKPAPATLKPTSG